MKNDERHVSFGVHKKICQEEATSTKLQKIVSAKSDLSQTTSDGDNMHHVKHAEMMNFDILKLAPRRACRNDEL